MASTSSSGGLVHGHVSRPTHVARCWRGAACPYLLRGRCGFGNDDLEGRVGEQIGAVPVPQIWEPIGEVVQLSPRERVQTRMPKQVVGVLVPQVMEDGLPVVPLERVQNRTSEQLVDVPVPQIMEAIVVNRFRELIVDVPVPQITEAIVEDRFPEQFVDVPVPQIMEAIRGESFPGADCEFSCASDR